MASKTKNAAEKRIEYAEMEGQTGFMIVYEPQAGGGVVMRAPAEGESTLEVSLAKDRVDEAHILYMEVTELLRSRAEIGQDHATIRIAVEQLFGLFRGEKPPEMPQVVHAPKQAVGEYTPNPGKKIEIDVDGVTYLRLPIKTEIITMRDTDILPLVETYGLIRRFRPARMPRRPSSVPAIETRSSP